MKKRKSPIILITLLVVIVGTIFVVNSRSNQTASNPQDVPRTTEQRSPETATSVANDLRADLGPGKKTAPKNGHERPSVVVPKINPVDMKPKPNDTTTAYGWR